MVRSPLLRRWIEDVAIALLNLIDTETVCIGATLTRPASVDGRAASDADSQPERSQTSGFPVDLENHPGHRSRNLYVLTFRARKSTNIICNGTPAFCRLRFVYRASPTRRTGSTPNKYSRIDCHGTFLASAALRESWKAKGFKIFQGAPHDAPVKHQCPIAP